MSRRVSIFGASFASGPAFTFLLDDFPGAVKAHSFRKLRVAYAGDTQRARENVTEANIPFLGNVQDNAALLTLAGANSAFMPIWRDQSTAAADSTQSVAVSQPKVVDGGVLETVNGYPVASFDEANDFLDCSDLIPQFDGATPFTLTAVVRNRQTTEQGALMCWGVRTTNLDYTLLAISNTTTFGGHRFFSQKRASGVSVSIVANTQLNTSDLYLLTADFDGNDYRLYVNGNLLVTQTDSRAFVGTTNFAEIGRRNSSTTPTNKLGSQVAEMVLWPSSQFAAGNISAINTEIMNYYGIT